MAKNSKNQVPKAPDFSTNAIPGTNIKILIMTRRVELGQLANHPKDLQWNTELEEVIAQRMLEIINRGEKLTKGKLKEKAMNELSRESLRKSLTAKCP